MTTQIRRVIAVFDKKTTMRLTQIEWMILNSICHKEKISRKDLLEMIKVKNSNNLGLTPAVRLFSLLYLYDCVFQKAQNKKGIQYIIDTM